MVYELECVAYGSVLFWNKILCVREASNFSVNISYMLFASAMVGELQTCVELIQIQHSEHIN